LFRWNYKKGYDVLIKSFLKEFSHKDDVSLVIMSKHAAMARAQPFSDAVFNEIAELVEEYATSESPPIYWSEDNIAQEDMPTIYGKCDCFVLPSRGEGQCLPALEASRMGLPTILPNHTAFTEYVDHSTSFTFDVDGWEVCNNNPKWGVWITKMYTGQEFPIFGDSVVEEVSALMREVKDNPDLAQKKVEAMNRIIDQKYTWEKCIEKASSELLEIING
jgi:glycosyltransferase involved in cell wall biosynthesis